jgi:ABC-type nitrate/sulfonate/bicarbonate transport system substrate-binding protein
MARALSFVHAGCIIATSLFTVDVASSQPLQKITIGISSGSIPAAGPRIAKEMGLFEKHGLDATVTPMDNGSLATMGLIAGSLNFTASAPTDVVVSAARGQDMVVISTVYSGFAAVMVLSKGTVEKLGVSASAPIAERLKALNGLILASPSATSTYTFAAKGAAAANGATVRLTYMDQPSMVAALNKGAIQGFLASAPYYSQSVLKGDSVIWVSGPKGEFPPQYSPANAVTLNALRSYAQANPDIVQRAVAVFKDFSTAVKQRPAEVKAALGRVFPSVDAATIDLLFETDSLGFATKPLTKEDMAREIAFVKASGAGVDVGNLDPAGLMLFPK